MKILVPVKRVVDYNVKVRPLPDQSDVDLNNVKMSVNPFCEIAVEEAVRLKEKGVATEIIVVTVGQSDSQEQLRACLALGADRAILVETQSLLEPLAIAKCLVNVVHNENPDLSISTQDGDYLLRYDFQNLKKFSKNDIAICPENTAAISVGSNPIHLTDFYLNKNDLQIKGHSLMMGYLNQELNKSSFKKDGFFIYF